MYMILNNSSVIGILGQNRITVILVILDMLLRKLAFLLLKAYYLLLILGDPQPVISIYTVLVLDVLVLTF